MKKILLPLLALVVVLLCVPLAIYWTTEQTPSVGGTVPAGFTPHPHGALANSSVLYPTFLSPGGSFRVGADSANVVRLVIPTSDRFTTPDGISTSSSLAEVRAVSTSPVNADGNFGYTVRLPSGWIARFDAVGGPPSSDTLVASVFAR